VGLNNDNSCSGCHGATAGFGDTQSIAMGIDNNFMVGLDRLGPRNQRLFCNTYLNNSSL
jgi:cytochrome c peroxidase